MSRVETAGAPATPDTSTSAVTRASDRVPVPAKLAYGVGGMAVSFYGHVPKNLATPILVATLGLSPTSVSIAMLIFRLYDAVIDPLMGWISDNTRTRWGRRRPYLVIGAVLTGLFLPVMWFISPDWSPQTQLVWFIGCGLVLYTFSTIYAMPYESLNLELTPDYNERTSVTAYKAVSQKIAMVVVGWAWFITQLPFFLDASTGKPDSLLGARALSIVVGVAIVVVGILPAWFTRERFYQAASKQAKVSLKDSFRFTLTNRPFVLLAAVSVCFATAYYLSGSMGFYIRLYYVTGGDQVLAAKITGVEGTLTMILGIASIPAFTWTARRIGKTLTLQLAIALTLLAMFSKWWTYTPDYPWLSMFNALILAPSLTGIWLMIPSMTGDVADDDELRTGERREGAFASIYSWVVKASFTAGLVMAGPIVEWCGFQVGLGAAQAPGTITSMRVMDAFIPAILLAASMFILWFYPLSPARMQEIRHTLESRRGRL
jgi:glycoside/pentoside/hexuronide:cation symporter, GPH family